MASPSDTAAAPTLFADKAPKRRKLALSWTPDEAQFAAAARDAWNAAFPRTLSYGSRASNVHHNNFVAIQFYRRNAQAAPAERFTLEDLRTAITAYAAECAKIDPKFVCAFAGWMQMAEDRIDKQLRRLGKPRGAGAEPDAADMDPHDAAISLRIRREFAALISVFERKPADHATPQAYVQHLAEMEKRGKSGDGYQRLHALCQRFDALHADQRKQLRRRARTIFKAVFSREESQTSTDMPRVEAVAIALYELDHRCQEQPPSNPHSKEFQS